MNWDPGPPTAIARIFEKAPLDEYRAKPKKFRLEWGPIYYRGRTNGSAKVLLIGQDPAADENVARRILVGTAGQRVQGFLAKLGISSSYIAINSVLYSIYGQFDKTMEDFMDLSTVTAWRNELLDALAGPRIEVVLVFGRAAQHVVDSWPRAASFSSQGRVFSLLHPTARPESAVLAGWSNQLAPIAAKLSPDSGATRDLTKYGGPKFKSQDLARIPLADFGFGAPAWMGEGDMARRLSSAGTIPASTKEKPTILWTATGKEG
jgi:hypothetical protein